MSDFERGFWMALYIMLGAFNILLIALRIAR